MLRVVESSVLFFSASSATEVAPTPVARRASMPVFAPFPNPSLSPKRKNWKPGIVAVVVLVIALIMAWAWRRGVLETNRAAAWDVRTIIVEQKDFVREVRIHGTVEAVESHTITAPSLSGQDL